MKLEKGVVRMGHLGISSDKCSSFESSIEIDPREIRFEDVG